MARLLNKSKHSQPARTVVIEVSRSDLTLVSAEKDIGEDLGPIHWHRVTWQLTKSSLFSDIGQQELASGFQKLVQLEHLAGSKVYLALSSDFCVTRVVSGENDSVDRELKALTERSAHYLSLGTGEKLLEQSARPIDARRKVAWMTVSDRRTLDAICAAAETAGLIIEWAEHSLLALCRAVGHTGRDSESPVLIVDVSQRGIDLGISHQGRLLLDYRPGGMAAKERVAETVLRHRKRLQRYCNRNFQFSDGRISSVYICGDPEQVTQVHRAFQNQRELVAEILSPDMVVSHSGTATDTDLPPDLTPSLGLLLAATKSVEQCATPNLVAPLIDARRGPLIPELLRTGWPIAAAIVLSLLVGAVNQFSHWQNDRLHAQSESLQAELSEVRRMQMKLAEADGKLRQAEAVKKKLFNPRLHELLSLIAGCMPDGMWLAELRMERNGAMVIAGKSRGEESIFEFLNYLRKAPCFDEVAIEGTRPERLFTEFVTYFEVRCRYVAHDGSNDRRGNHD